MYCSLTILVAGCLAQQTVASPTLPKPKVLRCLKSQEDMNLPHETSCKHYYRCVYSQKVPKICPEGMVFNKNIANCDFIYNVVDCIKNEEENYLQYKEIIEEITAENASKENQSEDTKELTDSTTILEKRFVYLPHETESNAYYMFENGKKLLKKCQKGHEFHFNLEVCVKVQKT